MDVPESERDARVFLTSDTCVIDDEHFFVRGCLEIPVRGSDDPFVWGVWVAIEQREGISSERVAEIYEVMIHGGRNLSAEPE